MKEEEEEKTIVRVVFYATYNSFLVHFMIITNTQSWQKSRSLNSSIWKTQRRILCANVHCIHKPIEQTKNSISLSDAVLLKRKSHTFQVQTNDSLLSCWPSGDFISFNGIDKSRNRASHRIQLKQKTLGLTNISVHEPVNIHKCIYI